MVYRKSSEGLARAEIEDSGERLFFISPSFET
jgi:hypothetical protein